MPIIPVQPGEVFEFTTVSGSSNVIAQFAGTSEVFTKDVFGIMRISGSNANLEIENEGSFLGNGKIRLGASTGRCTYATAYRSHQGAATSSLLTTAQWRETGSFIRFSGTGEHLVRISGNISATGINSNAGPVVRVLRTDSNTGRITIDPSGGGTINGQATQSCTDPFCFIEVTAATNGTVWFITGKVGNWT